MTSFVWGLLVAFAVTAQFNSFFVSSSEFQSESHRVLPESGSGVGSAAGAMVRAYLQKVVHDLQNSTAPTVESSATQGESAADDGVITCFLADTPVLESSVGYGHLGLNGDLGFEGGHVTASGTKYLHAVSTHTFSAPKFSFAKFDLRNMEGFDAKSAKAIHFSASVAINDKNNFFGRAGSPVTFVVVASSLAGSEQVRACARGAMSHLCFDATQPILWRMAPR